MKRIVKYVFLLPVFVGMMMSCSDIKTDAKKLEGKWKIVEIKGNKILEENLPEMNFDMTKNSLYGNSGCNIFNTTVELDPADVSAITIKEGASTMMACPNMDLETTVLQSMGAVKAVKAGKSADEMLLVDQDGNVLFVLNKK